MNTPLGKNQWSKKYERCVVCGTDVKVGNKKHKAKGMCRRDYSNYVYHDTNTYLIRKKHIPHRPYKNTWDSVKDDPVKRKKFNDAVKKWRRNNPIWNLYMMRRNKRIRYERFIKNYFDNPHYKWDKRHMGIVCTFNYQGVEFKMRTPLFSDKRRKLNDREYEVEYDRFNKELIKYLDSNGGVDKLPIDKGAK